ncbi:MAG: DNA repair protein RecO [Schleiferiaceae bacterium]
MSAVLPAQPALVLGKTPQGDRAAVLRIWLRSEGTWSAYVPSLRSSAGGFRPAMALPLASLELIPARGKGSLGRIKEARLNPPWRRLHDDPQAQMLVLYSSELLRAVLYEGTASPAFFDAVRDLLSQWDEGRTLASGALDMTLLVCQHLGFALEAPDTLAEDGTAVFYPAEGLWAPLGSYSHAALPPALSVALARAVLGHALDREGRNLALDALLAYLEAQHSGWGRLKSVEILRSL